MITTEQETKLRRVIQVIKEQADIAQRHYKDESEVLYRINAIQERVRQLQEEILVNSLNS